jgi:cyclic pyranopterin phosphate synthase
MTDQELSHLDRSGKARMVDVSGKPETERWAVAKAFIELSPETLQKIRSGDMKKGDVRAVAELAGVMAAKRTSELIPLCHPLPLSHIEVEVVFRDDHPGAEISATARTTAATGVEMEALTAAAVAALTLYDMVKAVEPGAAIREVRLTEKHGGKGGALVLE